MKGFCRCREDPKSVGFELIKTDYSVWGWLNWVRILKHGIGPLLSGEPVVASLMEHAAVKEAHLAKNHRCS